MSNTSVSPSIFCAENIALLSLLHKVVEPCQKNPTSNVGGRQETRCFSLEQERDLTSTLAFLAGISDDPNHIMALVIEELEFSQGLRVMIAINKKRPDDGIKILNTVIKGFESIFAILSKISRDPNPQFKDELFAAIISLCENRILTRMRSTKGKVLFRHRDKRFLGFHLKQAVDSIMKTRDQGIPNHAGSTRLSFVTESENLVKQLEEFENGRHDPLRLRSLLRDLVSEIYRLTRVVDIPRALSVISNRDMGPSNKESLASHMKKIARYRGASTFLFKLAKNQPVFQRAKVMPVHLDHLTFNFDADDNYTPTLSSSLSRIFNGRGPSKNVDQICQKLKINEQGADACLSSTFEGAVKESKIHAEIQLVIHYELNLVSLPPRVISSSKNACYLCNAFINFHGKYHIPRSHGRLYHAWRLPSLGPFHGLQTGFNTVLNERIKQSIITMLSQKNRVPYDQPAESTISSLAMSDSTIQGFAGTDLPTPPQTPATPAPCESSSGSEGISFATSSDVSSDISSSNSSDITLVRGKNFSNRTKASRNHLRYSANGLELLVEMDDSLLENLTTHHHKRCPFTVEWVSEEEARQIAENRKDVILNARSLSTTEDLTVSTRDNIYLEFGSGIIRIQA